MKYILSKISLILITGIIFFPLASDKIVDKLNEGESSSEPPNIFEFLHFFGEGNDLWDVSNIKSSESLNLKGTSGNQVLGSQFLDEKGDKEEKSEKNLVYEEWLDKLAGCESSHNKDEVVLDTNGRYSYGLLMFQKRTWNQYTKRYGLEHYEIMNPEHQKEVADKMLQENYNNWTHWENCTEKIGYPY